VKSGGGFCGPSPHTTTEASRLRAALAAIIVVVYLEIDILCVFQRAFSD
jgi:hypothetical protein